MCESRPRPQLIFEICDHMGYDLFSDGDKSTINKSSEETKEGDRSLCLVYCIREHGLTSHCSIRALTNALVKAHFIRNPLCSSKL